MASAEHRDIFHEIERQEAGRVRMLEGERGVEAAVAFARQTRDLYRSAVVSRSPPAGDAEFRLRLMAAYCQLKRYLADQ